jgi:hypothetical protein
LALLRAAFIDTDPLFDEWLFDQLGAGSCPGVGQNSTIDR